MIELFAWMTEMIIYRLNKVPEKTYLTLLNLVGLGFLPPQSAKALISFFPVKGYEGTIAIRRGTQVSTKKSEQSDILVFETEKELLVKNINLAACIGTIEGKLTDNLEILAADKSRSGFPLFSGNNQVERCIYISDPKIGFLTDNNIINVTFKSPAEIKSVEDELVNLLEWSYWNGKKWVPVECLRTIGGVHKKRDNEIYFTGPLEIEETDVGGETGFYLRGSLIDYPKRSQSLEVNEVIMNITFAGEGLNPDLCLSNTANMVFYTLDLGKDFAPFVDIPKYNDVFYIACDEVFSREDSKITLKIFLSDEPEIDKPEPNEDLILKYEYWNGRSWNLVGESGVKGVKGGTNAFEFTDTTNAFSKTGLVEFKRPQDMKALEVNNQEHFWFRIRIGAGNFGVAGQYRKSDDGKWEWVYDRPVKPPMLNRIRLFYAAEKKPPQSVRTYNEYAYTDYTKQNRNNFLQDIEENPKKDYFRLFSINKEKNPITYFGFDQAFPQGEVGIYFRVNEYKRVRSQRGNLVSLSDIGIKTPRKQRMTSLKWEYWDGSAWKNLSVNDYTDNFHGSGFVEFRCPEDMKPKSEFGKDLHWLRVIFESGSFELPPRILDIVLNSVYASNHHTYVNEILGSSNGTPSQVFDIFHGPVLPDLQLYVLEETLPPAGERDLILDEEGNDAIRVQKGTDGARDEIWIRYHEVENFYASRPVSRHFCVDYINNKILFGDGKKGMIPPRIKNNIRIAQYTTGGGVIGNVGAQTVTVLRENIPYVKGVTNPYSAEGGADLEDLESLKSRATSVFKNLNRAVTAEDYEWLALEASTSIGRSKCLSKCGEHGEVIVIIVPRPESEHFDLKEKLVPSSELVRRVKEFLDVRKLIGTRLRVESPAYRNISINLKVVFRKDVSEVQLLKERVEACLRRALHPMVGGPQGTGWPFGYPLSKNDIFNVLEKIEGIYNVEEIELFDNTMNIPVEKIVLDEDNLIQVEAVNIIERKSQY